MDPIWAWVLSFTTLFTNMFLGWFKGAWWTWVLHAGNAGVWWWWAVAINQDGLVFLSVVTIAIDGVSCYKAIRREVVNG